MRCLTQVTKRSFGAPERRFNNRCGLHGLLWLVHDHCPRFPNFQVRISFCLISLPSWFQSCQEKHVNDIAAVRSYTSASVLNSGSSLLFQGTSLEFWTTLAPKRRLIASLTECGMASGAASKDSTCFYRSSTPTTVSKHLLWPRTIGDVTKDHLPYFWKRRKISTQRGLTFWSVIWFLVWHPQSMPRQYVKATFGHFPAGK